MLVDCHTHLQPHGAAPPMTLDRIAAYVRAGEERGVTTVSITEHLFRFEEAYRALHGWWDADPDARLAGMVGQYWKDHVSGSVADYVRTVERAKAAGMPVLLGIEMDWIPGRAETLGEFLAPYDWDIVLGSVHYVGAFGIDDPEFLFEWERRDIARTWAEYGASMRDLAASGLADVLTHPDVLKKYGHRPADETPLHRLILEGAAVNGTAVEINSNGLRKPCNEAFPALQLLERAHTLGLPVTLASDAHHAREVGDHFDDLAAWARRAGYAEASWFNARKRQAYAI